MVAIANNSSGGFVLGDSVRGLKWSVAKVDERVRSSLCQKMEVPEILATILCNRGMVDIHGANEFLCPTLRSSMSDPNLLMDMDKAAARISSAIMNNEKVAIFGDYDVDGATSSALLKRFLNALGVIAEIYIPNRILEGYGPSPEAFEKLAYRGNTLIITVDCGTVSFDAMDYAKARGIDVIVLDHHLGGVELPKAYAIVNPNRMCETFPHKHLAAVGVVFFTVTAVRGFLRKQGYFQNRPEPDLMMYLDLVALGTVCDVMELKGVNRAFVAQGLKLINSRTNAGLAALSDVAKIDSKAQSYHLGFVIGPRINAGGRVGRGDLGAELLSTDDSNRAMEIALHLETLNQERKTLESITFEEAVVQIESEADFINKPMVMVSGENWHQGVLGIIASRLKERYGKPTIVISTHNGMCKGSSRSITGIDIGSMLSRAKTSGILTQGGGHAMAGGFSLEQHKLSELEGFFMDALSDSAAVMESYKDMQADAAIALSAVTRELVEILTRAAPFGSGNPQPKFLVSGVTVIEVRVVGDNHLMIIVADKRNMPNRTMKCMMFKALETEYGPKLLKSAGKEVHILGSVQSHYHDPKRADIIVDDIIFV